MSRIIMALLVSVFVICRPVLAAGPDGQTDVPLRTAASRHLAQVMDPESPHQSTAAAQGLRPANGWPERHPVLFRVLLGAGLGAAAGIYISNSFANNCGRGSLCIGPSPGSAALVGAGAGALVGLIASSN